MISQHLALKKMTKQKMIYLTKQQLLPGSPCQSGWPSTASYWPTGEKNSSYKRCQQLIDQLFIYIFFLFSFVKCHGVTSKEHHFRIRCFKARSEPAASGNRKWLTNSIHSIMTKMPNVLYSATFRFNGSMSLPESHLHNLCTTMLII